jgi:hypothetical protein
VSQAALFKTVAIATADPRLLQDDEVGSLPGVFHSGAEPREGDILIEVSDPRPSSLLFRAAPLLSKWAVVANDRSTFEKEMREAGWTPFFMAGEITVTAVGFDQSADLKGALTRLAARRKLRTVMLSRLPASRASGSWESRV